MPSALPRRPFFFLCFCFFIIAILAVVLGILASHSSGSDGASGLTAEAECSIVTGTLSIDRTRSRLERRCVHSSTGPLCIAEFRCRARIDVRFTTVEGVAVSSIAWSGLVETVYGECDAARAFAARFGGLQPTAVPCWYDPYHPQKVRLWSARDAGAAVRTEDDDGDDSALTVLVVLLCGTVILVAMATALRCGAFGVWQGVRFSINHQAQRQAGGGLPVDRWSGLPVEPGVVGGRNAELALGARAHYHLPPPLPVPEAPRPPEGALPPLSKPELVKEGLALVPKYLPRHLTPVMEPPPAPAAALPFGGAAPLPPARRDVGGTPSPARACSTRRLSSNASPEYGNFEYGGSPVESVLCAQESTLRMKRGQSDLPSILHPSILRPKRTKQ